MFVVEARDLVEEEVADAEDVDGAIGDGDEQIAAVEQRHQQSSDVLGAQLEDVSCGWSQSGLEVGHRKAPFISYRIKGIIFLPEK